MTYQEGAYQEGTYDSGSVIYDPVSPSTTVQPTVPAEPIISSPSDIVPEATEGSVVVPGTDGASNGTRKPLVDPSAFVIKSN